MSKFDNFSYTRWVKGTNRTIQIVLAITLWVALNYVASKQFTRKDINFADKYSLSQETVKYIEQIKNPVTIYVTKPHPAAEDEVKGVYEDISQLLREYHYASRRGTEKLINIEYISIYQDREKTQMLVEQFNITTQNAIIVATEEDYQELSPVDLYSIEENGDKQFKGEQVFTSAILNVANSEKKIIYWLTGHGEMNHLDVSPDRGLSNASQFLRQRGFALKPLDLSKLPSVPEDADLVAIAGPLTTIHPAEVEKLSRYLEEANGRLMAFLNPAMTHGLDSLLSEWGILADDMLLIDLSDAARSAGGGILINSFEEHPVTDIIQKNELKVLIGVPRPVRFDPGSPIDSRLTTTPIMLSSPKSWAERNYRQEPLEPGQTDLIGPVSIAAISERVVDSQLGLNIPGGRVAVFGNATFIANGLFYSDANHFLFSNTINWMLDQNNLLSIPPRASSKYQLPLTRENLKDVALGMLTLPLGVCLLGVSIFLLRRR